MWNWKSKVLSITIMRCDLLFPTHLAKPKWEKNYKLKLYWKRIKTNQKELKTFWENITKMWLSHLKIHKSEILQLCFPKKKYLFQSFFHLLTLSYKITYQPFNYHVPCSFFLKLCVPFLAETAQLWFFSFIDLFFKEKRQLRKKAREALPVMIL